MKKMEWRGGGDKSKSKIMGNEITRSLRTTWTRVEEGGKGLGDEGQGEYKGRVAGVSESLVVGG